MSDFLELYLSTYISKEAPWKESEMPDTIYTQTNTRKLLLWDK